MKNVIERGSKEIYIHNERITVFYEITENHNVGYNCAYIGLPEDDMTYGMFRKLQNDFFNIDVYGDVTYNTDFDLNMVSTMGGKNCVVFGWDYAHLDDFNFLNPEGAKHSIEEIRSECISAINQIAVILNN